jgi:hypothetical protein
MIEDAAQMYEKIRKQSAEKAAENTQAASDDKGEHAPSANGAGA